MNVWLVTTGSSDVQLTSDENWSDWRQEIKKSLYRLQFEPTRAIEDDGEPYRLHARVLGIAHDRLPEQVQPYLSFPLLQNFIQKLKTEGIQIDQIIILITDQENIFPESERETKRCPYWQDTCQLYPILDDYLGKYFPDAAVQPLILKPKASNLGLDNWDAVLELVQQEIANLEFETEPRNIYVSHQAGTPAISSAIQFCSLAEFGKRVKFLVSNEQNSDLTDIVKSSAYLRGIEIQQAEKLLARHDYLGIKEVLKQQFKEANESKDEPKLEYEILKHIDYLLDVSIQWNFAKFDDFAQDLMKYRDQNLVKRDQVYLKDVELAQVYRENADLARAYLEDLDQYWWWEAYEAAYLGVVRLKQGNTVEAMFHSFRAVEGLLKKWLAIWFETNEHSAKVEKKQKSIKLPIKVQLSNGKDWDKFNTYGQGLYFVLEALKGIDKDIDVDISIFGDFVFDRRNKLFHQLGGLKDKEAVFAEWKTPNESNLDEQGWKDRVKNCLNFVSDQQFASLEAASLMVKVHQELEKAIADL